MAHTSYCNGEVVLAVVRRDVRRRRQQTRFPVWVEYGTLCNTAPLRPVTGDVSRSCTVGGK